MPSFLIIFAKISIIFCLTCDETLDMPSEKKLTVTDLHSMQPKDIVLCLAHLGKEKLPNSNAEYIWRTIIKFYDGINNIPEQVLALLHWITVAVVPEDYDNITLSSIDVIQNFGVDYNLDESQLSAIANRVREDFSGKQPEDYTSYDLIALGQILCAFNGSEIERIHPQAYKEAASVIGKLNNCNPDVMRSFAMLAVQKKAFGPRESWTNKTTLKIVGKVVEYLG